ncbi:hypothetical protein SK224_05585 [Microbacterium sp. BG28]|uniref:hypothetical protein n=1 Tax=Microbacterium sp. BG28 TaxID=3097356 RepID=UPI002A5A524E|nr:hypothetical protein [Microbacterium sp. BG28]MDY0828596.1 hypothetical protein [Microbacterium sp. BG28]
MNLNAPPWLVELLQAVNLWEALIWLVGLSVACAWLVRFGPRVWRGTKALAKGILSAAAILAAVQELPAFIERADRRHEDLVQKVGEIHHEVHHNDGSSIKDSQKRIEIAIDEEIRPALAKLAEVDDWLSDEIERTNPTRREGDNVDPEHS